MFVAADELSHPIAVVHGFDYVKATNLRTGRDSPITCEDGSTVAPASLTWPRAGGAYAQLDERIVLDTRSVEYACFDTEDDDLEVDDVSPEGHVALRTGVGPRGTGGALSVVTLDGEEQWTAEGIPGEVVNAQFVDEDTLAVSHAQGSHVTTRLVDLDG